ncbi:MULTISPECIES: O-antigen ligase [Fusobacterium]|uniref:O-antigen ligase family protein n=1 Tax=Fusobacterium TaxID=848 RepID=UPI001477450E|nr:MULTISPECIES: O-antigen ligase family protein [Fusobacterium]NME35792.1 O-antigen ligase family protein [Fusobacterium sp. FSA-380-WT-3A]
MQQFKQEITLEKVTEYILYLYLICLCFSKGVINGAGGLFVFTSGALIYKLPNRKEFFKKYKYELVFTGIFMLGAFLEMLSVDGVGKSYKFFYKNFYFLMIPGLLYFFEKEEIRKRAFYLIIFSLFIGIIESFRQFKVIYGMKYQSWIRVESFFDIGRWGSTLQMVLLLILPSLRKKIFLIPIFILGLISLILNNSRGPWISFFSCVIIYLGYLLFYKKQIKLVLGMGALLIGLLIGAYNLKPQFFEKFTSRIETIGETEENYSNLGRLFMWKENILFMKDSIKDNKKAFYFGIGVENEDTFGEYVSNKESYKKANRYLKRAISFTDAHNMYIHTFVRKGIIYGVLFWGYMIYYCLRKLKERLWLEDEFILGSLLSTLSFFICGIFYSNIFTFDTFIFFTIFLFGVNYKYQLFEYKEQNKKKILY